MVLILGQNYGGLGATWLQSYDGQESVALIRVRQGCRNEHVGGGGQESFASARLKSGLRVAIGTNAFDDQVGLF